MPPWLKKAGTRDAVSAVGAPGLCEKQNQPGANRRAVSRIPQLTDAVVECITGPRRDAGRTGRYNRDAARVAKQVDARDLKSLDRKVIPVRFRSRAPK